MYEEIYERSPDEYWGKLKSHQHQYAKGQWRLLENKYRLSEYGFKCRHCQAYIYALHMISGVQNRNHCPFCLWSRHVDHAQAGDRMSACKANMQPLGLTLKRGHNRYGRETHGELMLIHRCKDCGKLSINRLAADDQAERLMELYRSSFNMDAKIKGQLEASGICLLQAEDIKLVVSQLHGNFNL